MSRASEITLLFPSDPLDRRHCDPHFRPESIAATESGLGVGVFDDMPLHQGGRVLDVSSLTGRRVIYRGWILSGGAYRQLAEAMDAVGAELVIGPGGYEEAHYLPGWYEAFKDHTPASVWAVDGKDDPLPLLRELPAGAAIVKDWSKSMKHLWEEACFLPDVADEPRALQVIDRFRELRGDDLHGLVLRRFEKLGAEYRSWWVDGEMRLLTAPPTIPTRRRRRPTLSFLAEDVRRLDARMVTVDVAESDHGWACDRGGRRDGQRPAGVLRPPRLHTCALPRLRRVQRP